MYELVTYTIGPWCNIYGVKIYTNNGILITQAIGYSKETARRLAHQRLTSKINTTLVPILPFHAL